MKNLPIEFSQRMKNLLGEEFENYEKAVNDVPVRAFRVNTDKISLEKFQKINTGEHKANVDNEIHQKIQLQHQ